MNMQMRGRISIRRERGSSAPGDPLNPHRPRSRTIEPWILEAAEGSTLQRLERAYLDALAAVDAVEDRKAASSKSGKFTSQGITDDALQFAASTCAPKLRRARQTLEAAKQEVAERRAKLTLKGPDKSDAATQILRLWKLDKFNALPDATRNAAMADAVSLDPDLAAAILQAPAIATFSRLISVGCATTLSRRSTVRRRSMRWASSRPASPSSFKSSRWRARRSRRMLAARRRWQRPLSRTSGRQQHRFFKNVNATKLIRRPGTLSCGSKRSTSAFGRRASAFVRPPRPKSRMASTTRNMQHIRLHRTAI